MTDARKLASIPNLSSTSTSRSAAPTVGPPCARMRRSGARVSCEIPVVLRWTSALLDLGHGADSMRTTVVECRTVDGGCRAIGAVRHLDP